MADVLLINPPWRVSNKSNIWRKIASCYPSLGLGYIAAVLERAGHHVMFLDMYAEGITVNDLLGVLKKREFGNMEWVGITSTTPLVNNAHHIAAILKQAYPHVNIVFGGVHPTVMSEEVLEDRNVDFVVRGEGEYTMLELVEEKKPKNEILGISYVEKGKLINNPDRPLIDNLDELPYPAYHLMPIHLYRPPVGGYKRLPAMSIFATRGCPGRCTFCCRIFEGKIRYRSAKKIVEEIKILKKHYGIKEINFYDDTFTAIKDNVREFCKIILDENIDLTWSCFTRANYVDKALFSLMKNAGCHQVMIGVESGVQQILDGMNKMITLDQIRTAFKICKEVGIDTRAVYILGNFGETKETMKKTLDFAKEIDSDYVLFNILTAYPGTKVWEDAKEKGWLRVKNYDYSVSDFTLELPTVSQREILDVYRRAHKEYYLRPKLILRRLLKLRSFAQIKQEILGVVAILMNVD